MVWLDLFYGKFNQRLESALNGYLEFKSLHVTQLFRAILSWWTHPYLRRRKGSAWRWTVKKKNNRDDVTEKWALRPEQGEVKSLQRKENADPFFFHMELSKPQQMLEWEWIPAAAQKMNYLTRRWRAPTDMRDRRKGGFSPFGLEENSHTQPCSISGVSKSRPRGPCLTHFSGFGHPCSIYSDQLKICHWLPKRCSDPITWFKVQPDRAVDWNWMLYPNHGPDIYFMLIIMNSAVYHK